MADKKIRDYEVSIWSLQDEFITVLKAAHLENKGMISEPSMKLSTDGTQELSFSIPMYLYEGARRIENPIWYNTRNGNLIINMRKIKVIFNKATEDEKVFDFMITKVTDRHEGDQLYCDVDCEGLAFHELGKIGYKISLSSEDFYNEDYEWFVKNEGEEPRATMDYWLQKFLPRLSDLEGRRDANTWYYKVEMDWSMYAETSKEKRASDKVYEEPYVSAWTDDLAPKTVQSYKEKERMVDLEESNVYNLTQNIAEKFGVFCRYEYGYDDNYHIISRTIVFYNNFIQEKQGYISLTYPYGTDSIKREIDSSDLTTKMYVKPANNDNSASGWSTIMNVDANKSLEDYILNFDYCHETGAITAEQYAEVKAYEARVRELNKQLIEVEQEIESLEQKLPDVEAAVTLSTNAIQLDKERLTASTALYENLDRADGVVDGYIEISASNPVTAVLMQDSSRTDNAYYFNVKELGINYGSLTIYKTIDYTKTSASERLKDPILTGQPVYDDFGNLTKITNIFAADWPSKIVYLTYLYSPKTYYERVKRVWETRLAKDEAALEEAQEKLKTINEALDGQINEETGEVIKEGARSKQKSLIERLQKERDNFARMMGPALREGYWQPDDFNDYGDNYQDAYLFLTDGTEVPGNSNISTLIWDENAFDEEQKSYYELGADQIQHTYPYVELTWEQAALLKEKLSTVSLMFYQKTAALIAETQAKENETNSDVTTKRVEQKPLSEADKKPNNYRCFSLGSQMQLAFKLVPEQTDEQVGDIGKKIIPILLITGAESLSIDEIIWMMDDQSQACLGTLTYESKKDEQGYSYADLKSEEIIKNLTWGDYTVIPEIKNESGVITQAKNCVVTPITLAYPRIQINSLFLKIGNDFLTVKCNAAALENYEDYSVLMENGKYYITLKPEVFITNINTENVKHFEMQTKFSLSNADTSIYLDAVQVIKENSRPQVSYEVKPCAINADFIYNDYNKLARIVNINDVDLKFDGVQGYISELDLDLDEPWEDSITIKNYKTKFEDLFSSIVAQTEAMKKSEYTIGLAGSLFMSNGQLSGEVVQDSLKRVDLNYAFNNGKLTIDEKNGIIGLSDSGVVAMRGGGIFTATEKDPEGNWVWNTGIVPQGINADLITSGQIDTNRIKIYAGDRAQFQFNEKGIYAYKTYMQDLTVNDEETLNASRLSDDGRDLAQYLVMNSEGLFLRVEPGALLLNSEHTAYIPTTKRFDRVAITWDGLTLCDAEGRRTFFTDPNRGDLYLAGTIFADDFRVLPTSPDNLKDGETQTAVPLNDYIKAQATAINWKDAVQLDKNLKTVFDEAGQVLRTALTTIDTNKILSEDNATILKIFQEQAAFLHPTTYTDNERPTTFRPGDIWKPQAGQYKGDVYLAMSYSSESQVTDQQLLGGWNKITDGSIASIAGAGFNIDAAKGTFDLYAGSKMTLRAKSQLDLDAEDLQITGNNSINIGSKWINIGSANGGINIISTDIDANTSTGTDGKVNTNGTISNVLISREGIALRSSSIELATNDALNNISVLSLNPEHGIWLGSNKEIRLFTQTIATTGTNLTEATAASVLLSPDQIKFGVNSTDNGAVVEIKKDYVILATAAQLDNVEEAIAASWENNTTLSGIKITNEGIWMAAGTATERGILALTPQQITLGVAASSGNEGSFIKLSRNEMTIGAKTTISIDATNIGLSSVKGDGSSLTANDRAKLNELEKKSSRTDAEEQEYKKLLYSDVGFRLGPASDPALVFANNNLIIKGQITATSLLVGKETISKYVTNAATTAENNAKTYADTKAGEAETNANTNTSTLLKKYYTSEQIENNYYTKADTEALTRNAINTQTVTFTSHPSSYKTGDIWYDGTLIKKAIRKNDTFSANDWEIIDVASKQQTFTEEPMIFEQGNLWYQREGGAVSIYTANGNSGWQLVNVAFYSKEQPTLAHKKDDLWYDTSAQKLYKAESDYDPSSDDVSKNTWGDQKISFGTSTTSATEGQHYYYKDKLYVCIKEISSSPWQKLRDESNKTYTITRTTNTDTGDSTLINKLNATFIEGDMLYIIYESKVVGIKRYTNNDWQDVSQTIEVDPGSQTFRQADPPTSFKTGDIWYVLASTEADAEVTLIRRANNDVDDDYNTSDINSDNYYTKYWDTVSINIPGFEGTVTYSGDMLPSDTQFAAGSIWYKGGTIYKATKKWDEQYSDTTWTGYWQEITALTGPKTFTGSQPEAGTYKAGDIWYDTTGETLKIYKAETKNGQLQFSLVEIPTAEGTKTFITSSTDTIDTNIKNYHEGDIWYKQEDSGTYTILRADKDNTTYDIHDWSLIDLPVYQGRQVYYSSAEEIQKIKAVEGDIWYEPIDQVPGYKQYIYTTLPVYEETVKTVWTWNNILASNEFIAVGITPSANNQYNVTHVFFKYNNNSQPTILTVSDASETLDYLCNIQWTMANDKRMPLYIPITDNIPYHVLFTTDHTTPSIESYSDLQAGDYWIPRASDEDINNNYRKYLYQLLVEEKIISQKSETETRTAWIEYTPPRIKGAKLSVDSDAGKIKISATDDITIFSSSQPLDSTNDLVTTGGCINIQGTQINIEASSELRFGYTQVIQEGKIDALESGVLINSNGIQMFTDSKFIVNAGNVQISANAGFNNYIRFGENGYSNLSTNQYTRIDDTGLYATFGNFDSCYVGGSPVCTTQFVNCPILYSASGKSLPIPAGYNYAILVYPAGDKTTSTDGTYTRTFISSARATGNKVSKTSGGQPSYTYSFSGTPSSTSGTALNNIASTTLSCTFYVYAAENNKTGNAVVTVTFANGISMSSNAFNINNASGNVLIKLSQTIDASQQAFGDMKVTSYWTGSGNPGLYVSGNATVSLTQTGTYTTTASGGDGLSMKIITN